jgi:hypothetical protein
MGTAKAQENTVLLITVDDLATMNVPQNITVTNPDGSSSIYTIHLYENNDGNGGMSTTYSWENVADLKTPSKEPGE